MSSCADECAVCRAAEEEPPHRRSADAINDSIRTQAVAYVFDGIVDRGELKVPLTPAQLGRVCREYEARLRALGGL
jgi:hypothetical protein